MTDIASPAASSPTAVPARDRWLPFIERYALVGMLLGVIVLFSLLPQSRDVFPTTQNLQILLANQSVLLVTSLAVMIPLLTYQYDLSTGNIVTVSTVAIASAMADHGVSVLVAPLVGIAAGVLIGSFNGWLSAYVGVNPLIVTLGVATAISGILSGYTGGKSIVTGLPEIVSDFGTAKPLGIPLMFMSALAVAAVLEYLVRFLPVGRRLIAVGSNAQAARLVGINVRRMVLLSFAASGFVAGIAGALQLAQTGAANPTLGGSLTLPALAAVFLGATTIKPGTYNIPGTIIAVLFLGALTSGLSLAGLPDWVNTVVDGAALVAGVAFSAVVSNQRSQG
jgi:ribose transport system permease protein